MNGWDELWLDIRQLPTLSALMGARLDRAVAAGCSGIEPDNTDCFSNDECWKSMANPTEPNGNAVKAAQLAYLSWLSTASHAKGLLVGLKNTVDLADGTTLHQSFDFAINEECLTYDECDTLSGFVDDGKAILGAWVRRPWAGGLRRARRHGGRGGGGGGGRRASSAACPRVGCSCAP